MVANNTNQGTSSSCHPRVKRRPQARLTLFCFPYAGGSAAVFKRWRNLLPDWIDVYPIDLPGRGRQTNANPFSKMEPLVDTLETALYEAMDRPFAFWGYSVGAIIGFELAHRVYAKRRVQPIHLFVVGRAAPHIRRTQKACYNLPESELRQRLRELGGTPQELLTNDQLLNRFLPILRADLELTETYEYVPRPKLTCPITAIGGIADTEVRPEDIQGWREHSSGPFCVRMLPGNHFFFRSHETELVQFLTTQLQGSACW